MILEAMRKQLKQNHNNIYMLFKQSADLDPFRVRSCMEGYLSSTLRLITKQENDEYAFLLENYMDNSETHPVDLQIILRKAPTPVFLSEAFDQPIHISNVYQLYRDSGGSYQLTLCSERTIEHKTKLKILQQLVNACLELIECHLIYIEPSRRLVDPAICQGGKSLDISNEIVSVTCRSMSHPEYEEVFHMRTYGFEHLGLPEIHCTFHTLNPAVVELRMWSMVQYALAIDGIIEDKYTVFDEGWECQHYYPERPHSDMLINLNPGAKYSII